MTLDTGASVTIVLKELLKPEQMTGKKIYAECANAATWELEQARAEIRVGDCTLTRVLAVALREQLKGVGLAFDLSNKE